MTETILTIGIPTLAVLVGILLNRNDANRLDGCITQQGIELRAEFARLSSELRTEIAATRKQSHDDIMTLVGIAREHGERITRIEQH